MNETRPGTGPATADDTRRDADALVAGIVARARAAQRAIDGYTQAQADLLALAAGWAIMEPARNRVLAELAVADTGLGNVPDKVRKNHRKTLGLLRDLQSARTVGVIAEDPARGLTEIARPVGVVAAITPSTNPGATPANKIINALKCRNAIVVAPSPKGWSTCAKLLEFVHAELARIGAPTDLVQMLPAPVTKATTHALMRQADLIVATGSQSNIRAAYSSGTPAFGVGAGNVAGIVDASADCADAAAKVRISKTFDNATSCSSENSLVVLDAVWAPMLEALAREGGVLLDDADRRTLQAAMWPDGHGLNPALTARDAPTIAAAAGLRDARAARAAFLVVEESGAGPDAPFSGEKLSPVLALYRARDFDHACEIVERIYAYQGAGHSVGLHSSDDAHARRLAERLPVARVIVNQAHCIATGGSFDNGLPFSLSMGCGTWGGNGFSENLHWRQYLNVTRIARPIPEHVPDVDAVFASWFDAVGR
jgi:sulfoacetaldehyde dehydrogenase